jgi:hypothetical protein
VRGRVELLVQMKVRPLTMRHCVLRKSEKPRRKKGLLRRERPTTRTELLVEMKIRLSMTKQHWFLRKTQGLNAKEQLQLIRPTRKRNWVL